MEPIRITWPAVVVSKENVKIYNVCVCFSKIFFLFLLIRMMNSNKIDSGLRVFWIFGYLNHWPFEINITNIAWFYFSDWKDLYCIKVIDEPFIFEIKQNQWRVKVTRIITLELNKSVSIKNILDRKKYKITEINR